MASKLSASERTNKTTRRYTSRSPVDMGFVSDRWREHAEVLAAKGLTHIAGISSRDERPLSSSARYDVHHAARIVRFSCSSRDRGVYPRFTRFP
jgi:hypothetical protein